MLGDAMEITRVFKWHASHKLCLPYKSKCNATHGHTYTIEVTVEGQLNEEGMVVDFSQLDGYVNQHASFDHMHLNNLFEFKEEQPTAENLVRYIKKQLDMAWPFEGVSLKKIRVWETEKSYAQEEYACLVA